MNVIDVSLIVLVAAAVVIGSCRGFGRTIFDFTAIFVALRSSSLIAPAMAKLIHPAQDAPGNEAFCLALIFLISSAALIYAGKLAYYRTRYSLEMFDPFLGGVLGLAIGVMVGHILVSTLAVAAGIQGQSPEVLSQSRLGYEFYQFDSYHRVMHFLYTLGA